MNETVSLMSKVLIASKQNNINFTVTMNYAFLCGPKAHFISP